MEPNWNIIVPITIMLWTVGEVIYIKGINRYKNKVDFIDFIGINLLLGSICSFIGAIVDVLIKADIVMNIIYTLLGIGLAIGIKYLIYEKFYEKDEVKRIKKQ